MTRKTKIVIGFVVILVSVSAVNFFVREFGGEVRVACVGVSPHSPDFISFAVTNTSRNPVVYYLEGLEDSSGVWIKSAFRYTNYTGKIMACGTETFGVKVQPKGRWRVVVLHGDSWSSSSLARFRSRLAHRAFGFRLTRLSQWLQPQTSFRRAPGPEMVGHTSAPPLEK